MAGVGEITSVNIADKPVYQLYYYFTFTWTWTSTTKYHITENSFDCYKMCRVQEIKFFV